jgi:aminoglycoside 6'-N-acetyltransferase I
LRDGLKAKNVRRVTPLPVKIRPAVPSDLDAVTQLAAALWSDAPVAEHREHAASILSGRPKSAMPLVLFVAEVEGNIVGFIEVGLRSHADGCDERHAVGFIEGWYTQPPSRGHGIGRRLMAAAEEWARSVGARELASDTWLDNEPSQLAHEALGFDVVDRVVNYKKSLEER